MFGAIAGGIASALAGGAMSKLFGGGQKAASGGIQGDVLATDNNTVGMGDAGIKFCIQGSNVPNPDVAVPSFVSGAMAKAGKGLLEGTLQAGTSPVSDQLLDSGGLGGKSAADKGKDTRDYLAAAFPELNAWELAGADASSAGMVDARFENQKELTKMQLDNQKEIADMQNETQKEIACIQSATSRFFFQAEEGIRDIGVTGVQTCALPIFEAVHPRHVDVHGDHIGPGALHGLKGLAAIEGGPHHLDLRVRVEHVRQKFRDHVGIIDHEEIGRASCRERV